MKIEISDNKKWQHSLTLKMGLLAILGIMLLIPLEMIKSIIKEREMNSGNVIKEISFQWAGEQSISGPVLNIPVKVFKPSEEGGSYNTVFHLMPDNLNVAGDIGTEKRYRSIYQAVVFTADLKMSGDFIIPLINIGEKSEIMWDEAYFTVGISDNRGLKGEVIFSTDSINIEAVPGLSESDLFSSGLTFPISLNENKKNLSFAINMKISGSEHLSFLPAGKITRVNLRSAWDSPGFSGKFLPVERTIDRSGFVAEWQVTNLNRNFPQSWAGKSYNPSTDAFGVDFILPVDHYQKSLRSAKYGILFIALTFLALLFAEMTTKGRIHIFHYLLVSLGLVLFFSLLNALSEHTGFNLAYLISAGSTILLISGFLRSLIRQPSTLILIVSLLVFLYFFIFILLTLNDYAYLAGNIGLFVLLAITMRLSVKLNIFRKEGSDDTSGSNTND